MRRFKVVAPLLLVISVLLISGVSVFAGDAAKININKASVEELTQLQGIGQKYAAQIVAYRDQNGPFVSPQDLMKVPGIGQKTFDKNKGLIVVE